MIKITRAAIRQDGIVYHVPIPGRHHDVIRIMIAHYGLPKPVTGEQGFIADDGLCSCFVSRKMGYEIARKAGQFLDRAGNGPELFSEDLWEGFIDPKEPLYYIFKERYLWVDDMQETNKRLLYYQYCRVGDNPKPERAFEEDPYKQPNGVQAVIKYAFQCGPYLEEDTGAIIDALNAELRRDGQPTPCNVLEWEDMKKVGLADGNPLGTPYA